MAWHGCVSFIDRRSESRGKNPFSSARELTRYETGPGYTYTVSQMQQYAISALHMVRFQTGDQRSNQMLKLRCRQGSRWILCVDEDGLIGIVGSGATKGKSQQIRIRVVV